MILVINVCKEKLHYFEFVKPIEDILKETNLKFFVRHYKKISSGDLKNANRIIICGTSLKDNEFVKDINYFSFLRTEIKKPILGICAGMQIIGLIFDLNSQVRELSIKNGFKHLLKYKTEVGFYSEEFKKEFLGLKGLQEVYHLHNYHIDFKKLNDFDVYCEGNEIVQAIKHKEKWIYGVLFHPEVRQKHLINKFCSS